jgi:5'-3' exonuclease
LCVEMLEVAGVPVIGCPDYEAEDVIGALAKRARGTVAIVSGDRDLFQLVRDPDVYVLFPVRGVSDLHHVDESYIKSKYGIPGRAYADFAILRGDPSDGLPGVRGIGEKTATALVSKYGNIEKIVAAAKRDPAGPLGKVAGQLDYIKRVTSVVRITGEAPIGRVTTTLRPPAKDAVERATAYALNGPMERLLQALEGVRKPN